MSFEFINGAEVISRAALAAGCNFFAGYPITPATPILLNMMRDLPEQGGISIQGEDEIASISMCIAASMAGRKAMTATSGPGISLYSESIGLAVMGEVPLVIVNAQRLGPATGGATTGAQGDIQFVRWVTSGGLQSIVLCPCSMESIFRLTVHAFNIAEALRTPVFLLTSKDMVLTKQTIDISEFQVPAIVERTYFKGDHEFIPYRIETLSDIPEFLPIGGEIPVRFTTSMHDERGFLTKEPLKVKNKFLHLNEKIISASTLTEHIIYDEQKDAELLILSYGINTPVCRDAVIVLRSSGKPCSHLIIESLFPVPEVALKNALSRVKTIILPELNLGLYAKEIQPLLSPGQTLIPVNRVDGNIFSMEDILSAGGMK